MNTNETPSQTAMITRVIAVWLGVSFVFICLSPCGNGGAWPRLVYCRSAAIFIAALDYGDVWICVGRCEALIQEPED